MPKKKQNPKAKKSKFSLFTWPKILVLIVPLILGGFLLFNASQESNVLGDSDYKFNKEKNPSTSPKPTSACKPIRITSISFSSPCTDNKFGFQKADYVCADSTTGSINSTKCGNPEKIFEQIKKACNKNSTCKKPEVSKIPKPSILPKVSKTPTVTTDN